MKVQKTGIVWQHYFLSICLVVAATVLGLLVQEFFDPTNIIMMYLLCVTVAAVFWGLGPSVFVSISGVLTFDFFFVPPHHTFAVDDTQYIFTFISLLAVGVVISYLTSRTRRQTEDALQREKETSALYTLGHDLVVSGNLSSHIKVIARRIEQLFGYHVFVFLPEEHGSTNIKLYADEASAAPGEPVVKIASEMYASPSRKQSDSGRFVHDNFHFFPLTTARGIIGVMVFRIPDIYERLSFEQERLLKAYIDLAAVAIEGMVLAEQTRNAQIIKETEKLQTALLNAISHDLKTPLVSVIGVLSSLQEKNMNLDESAKENLIQVAREEAEKLNHLISNLLDESRIEAGALTINRKPVEVQDLIGTALEQLGDRTAGHKITIDIPDDVPFVFVDVGLFVQALVNVIDNALKYSPPDTPITIEVLREEGKITIRVIDRGIGIPVRDTERIFDKFYRIKRPGNVAGTGMGLSISKGIIEAHGGHIKAGRHPGGGTIITISLPFDENPPRERSLLK